VLHIKLDPESPLPAYEQISRSIRQLMLDGLLAAGTRLPSMRELSEQLGVSLNTVHAACDVLAAENLIVTRRGSGTVVTDQLAAATGANLRTRGMPSASPVNSFWSRLQPTRAS
jgi:GntR family transcriptional regulator